MSITPAFLDELRHRTSLSALIGRTVKLQKNGNEWKACCPFHNEKTPSFYVNDDKAFYHCFGCSAHGDAIRWLTEQRGLSFIDAVKELALAAGMEMPAADPRAAEKSERQGGLVAASEAAREWFTEQLQGIAGGEARAYLARRGISDAQAKAFGIGFAPDSRGKLKGALASFGTPTLVEAGLLIAVDDKEPYDRFRGRLMIPIRDPRGRTIAFGGRIIGPGEPKYLNSPDTPLFDKGRTLYNLDRASPASRKAGRLIVVEGYMDVIGLAGVGIDEVVAPNGTAVTEAQLERMWRLAEMPILCFDGDAAGQKAAARTALRALPFLDPKRRLSFVTLPDGQDPDDLARSGGREAVEALLSQARVLSHFLWSSQRDAADVLTPEGRAALRSRLDEIAELIKDYALRGEFRQEFRDRFYAEFGWRARSLKVIENSVIETSRDIGVRINESYVRSAMYGLSRFTNVATDHFEQIAQINVSNRDLGVWRDQITTEVVENPRLDQDAIATICERPGISSRRRATISSDLMFGFMKGSAANDNGRAVEQLTLLIDGLSSEPKLLEEITRLDELIRAASTLDAYNALSSEREAAWAEVRALRDRGVGYNQSDL